MAKKKSRMCVIHHTCACIYFSQMHISQMCSKDNRNMSHVHVYTLVRCMVTLVRCVCVALSMLGHMSNVYVL